MRHLVLDLTSFEGLCEEVVAFLAVLHNFYLNIVFRCVHVRLTAHRHHATVHRHIYTHGLLVKVFEVHGVHIHGRDGCVGVSTDSSDLGN
jgi:hypothetical protein